MVDYEQQILALIRDHPQISQSDIASRLGVSRIAIAGQLMNLRRKDIFKAGGYEFSDFPYVVIAGGMNIDLLGTPANKLHLGDSNPGAVRTSPGGVARNIAENLARLSIESRLISAVGNDQYGEFLLRHGRATQIDMQHVVQLDELQTSTYLSVLDDTGDMHVAISDMAIMDQLGPEHLQACEEVLKQSILIVIDANLNDRALAWLTSVIADQALFVDTVSTTKATRIKPYLSFVHTLKTNLIEAESIAGTSVSTDDDLAALAEWFHTRGVERLFVTLGERGVFYSTGDAQKTIPLPENHNGLVNAGGAGDAFVAGLAYAWLNQWGIEKSVGFSLAAAAITLSSWQTNSPELSLAAVTRIYETNYAD